MSWKQRVVVSLAKTGWKALAEGPARDLAAEQRAAWMEEGARRSSQEKTGKKKRGRRRK